LVSCATACIARRLITMESDVKRAAARPSRPAGLPPLPKCPTGIAGFDEITGGGLPRGRPSLLCGAAGCGKTLFSMEFLVRGAMHYDEPGVFIAFEETAEDLRANVASLGFDLESLIAQKKLVVDYVQFDPAESAEAGEYDLEGLFIRLALAIDSIGAKRVVIDTLEVLFAGLNDQATLRAELRRLFQWLKERRVTAIITGERGADSLTRHGIEEYVSDCVVLLDHRVTEQISTRRLRIVKYRGSRHGTNEYPFLISEDGFFVMPITSLSLGHAISHQRISSGVPRLDTMLGGAGYFRGSSVLISGTAGSGKSILAAMFADACCARGERCLYFAFEESPAQIIRNMASVGLNLQRWLDKGLLRIIATRSFMQGLEMHLSSIHKQVDLFRPAAVIIDPITNFTNVGSAMEVEATLSRLIDYLKKELITSVFLSLTASDVASEQSSVGVSSVMDTWILLRNLELNGERNRGLYVLKSRGMGHSNQIREFRITAHGLELSDVYIGSEGVLMGTARVAQEAKERAQALFRRQQIERQQRDLLRKRKAMDAQIEALQAQYDAEAAEIEKLISQAENDENTVQHMRQEMATLRQQDAQPKPPEAKADIKSPSRRRK
jgi:circadian clock protein KaiC